MPVEAFFQNDAPAGAQATPEGGGQPGGGQPVGGPRQPGGGPGGAPGGGPGGFGPGGFGGGRGGGGRGFGEVWIFDLLGRDNVRTELNITETQKTKLEELNKTFDEPRQALRGMFQGMRNPEEFQTRMEEMRKKQEELRKSAEEKANDILTSTQFTRYRQIFLQGLGTTALGRDDVAGDLKLTDEQKGAMKKVTDDFRAKQQQMGFFGSPEERQKLNEDRDAALKAVLTSAQQADWDAKLGAKFDSEGTATAGGAAPTRGGPTAGADQPRRRDRRNVTEGESTGTVVADFTGKAPRPKSEISTDDPASEDGDEEITIKFNFQFAPWDNVLKLFAETAKLSLDMNEVPTGTFNYYNDDKNFTVKEALDILNSYLLRKGFVLIFRDRTIVVWNLDDPPPPNLIPQVSLEELEDRGNNELLSVIIPLTGTDAKTAAEDIRELVGPQGKVVPLGKVNRLFVTDIGANLREIYKLLDGIGKVAELKSNFRQIKLKHIMASEADRTIRDLFSLPARTSTTRMSSGPATVSRATPAQPQQPNWPQQGGWGQGGWGQPGGFNPGGGGGEWWRRDRGERRDESAGQPPQQPQQPGQPAPAQQQGNPQTARIACSVDTRTNSLLITASPEDMALIEKTIESIDVEESKETLSSRGANQPQLEVYALNAADPRMVVDMLNATVPGLVIYEDLKTRRVSVYASPSDQQQVKGIIKTLDTGAPESVSVVNLRKLDPVAAAASLRSLFGGNSADAPSIEADAVGKRLMVRGSPDQVAEIRKVLAQLGEDGTGNGQREGSGSPIRTIDLGGRSGEELLSLIENLAPASSKSVIRVVRPKGGANPLFKTPNVPGAERPLDRSSELFDKKVPTRESTEEDEQPPVRSPRPRAVREEAAADAKRGVADSQSTAQTESVDELARQLDALLDDMEEAEAEAAEPTPKAGASKTRMPARSHDTEVIFTAQANGSGDDSNGPSEVRVSVVGGKLVISGQDMQALDNLEGFIQSLIETSPNKTRWTVRYLQAADATETATMLGALFPQGSVTQTATQNTSIFGSMTSGLTSLGGNLMDMSGMSLGKGGPALRIIPEPRSNSLFISGPSEQVGDILSALDVLDAAELPESLKDRVPRMLPVEFADANEVAAIIRDVYKEQLDPNMGNPIAAIARGGQGGGGFNPLAMMLGGGAQQGGRQQRGIQLTLGVDERTNTLIVSSSEQLFRQVEALVEAIDDSARDAKSTVRVVTLSNSNTVTAGQALSSLLGKVKVNAGTSTATRPGAGQGGNRGGGAPFAGGQGIPGGGFNPAAFGGGQFGGGQFGGGQFGGGQFGGGGGRGGMGAGAFGGGGGGRGTGGGGGRGTGGGRGGR